MCVRPMRRERYAVLPVKHQGWAPTSPTIMGDCSLLSSASECRVGIVKDTSGESIDPHEMAGEYQMHPPCTNHNSQFQGRAEVVVKVSRRVEAAVTLGNDTNRVLASHFYDIGQEMDEARVPGHALLASAHLINNRLVLKFEWNVE